MAQKQKRNLWLTLPRTKPDVEVPFNFNTYKFRSTGSYFIGLNLITPLLVLMITSFTLERNSLTFSAINLITTVVCLAFSFFYISRQSSSKLTRSGLLIFYTYILIPNLIVFIFSLVLLFAESQSQWITVAQIWFQLLGELIVIFLAFRSTADLTKRFQLTLKFNWKWILVILAIGVFAMWGVDFLYNLIFHNTVLGESSNNQNSLVDILENPESPAIKIFYIFTLLIFTVGVAPLAEELACRHAWFIGSGNRLAGLLSAPIYFGYIHVQTGDVEHILTYVLSGVILSTIFSSTRGNVVYSWIVHASFNLLVFILLLV